MEIEKLHKMLTDAGIEHEWHNHIVSGYQIIMYKKDGERLISAIEGYGTYGYKADLIEIMGLLTPEEEEHDSVVGWLTAEEVFRRIKEALG